MPVVSPAHSEPLIRNDETMRYRPFGKTGWDVSALSFGCMRLKDDPELNKELISKAIDLGVNYFESTRYYLGGTCQHRTAPGLEGKTAGVIVSGKERINSDQTAYLFRKEIERQLEILGLSHFKFFQVGWFHWGNMPHLLKQGGVLDAIRQAKAEGLIQCVGFTGHDSPENFIRCIETGLFDSLTVPYNLINRSYEPTIKRAGELGVGVVAMCPVAGGVLACESSRLKEALQMDLPTTEMALRFVLSNPDVSTACSGMNTSTRTCAPPASSIRPNRATSGPCAKAWTACGPNWATSSAPAAATACPAPKAWIFPATWICTASGRHSAWRTR
jgi:predicted aldo/keto reductase-like oxidoreductase